MTCAVRAVYVAALNRKGTLAGLGEALEREPYLRPPVAPVLHLKPANTWRQPGAAIPCPAGVPQLRMGGSLGLLIGRTACRVTTAAALGHVAGYLICNDVSIPYSSHYRPAIRERCRDGFCPMSPPIPAKAVATQPDQLAMTIAVNGLVRSRSDGSDLVRGAARLVAEISEFITLDPGDLVLLGEPADAPLASPGDRVRIEIPELGFLENEVVAA